MSRTIRRDAYVEANHGHLTEWQHLKPHKVLGDGKKPYKPGRVFKALAKAKRRAKAKDAMTRMVKKEAFDDVVIPNPPKEDQWNWS